MVVCTRRGCGVEIAAASSSTDECRHHPGAPVFHEGLKSWSCCNETNKPVLEFDDFLAIPGCATAQGHTQEKQHVPTIKKGKEVTPEEAQRLDQEAQQQSSAAAAAATASNVTQPLSGTTLAAAQNAAIAAANTAKKEPKPEEQDPQDKDEIAPDAACKRSGCQFKHQGGKRGDRSAESCLYHPGSPIFHEGSKGWSCCKRRVLDFDDFLHIQPCTEARHGHLFFGQPAQAGPGELELIDCRMDHYETPNDVRLTVYAKAVEVGASSIQFHEDRIVFDLALPALPSGSGRPRRFVKTLRPFAPILPQESSFNITKFKVDLVLSKHAKGQSWPCLEQGDKVLGYGLTFGRDKDR